MQFDDVLLGRRSIRGYKPDPVPKALIKEILGMAMRSPSSMNTQPWSYEIYSRLASMFVFLLVTMGWVLMRSGFPKSSILSTARKAMDGGWGWLPR